MSWQTLHNFYNFKGATYPIAFEDLNAGSLSASSQHPGGGSVTTLLDLCCRLIVLDSASTVQALSVLPPELFYSLMKAAVHCGRDRSIEVLISKWPSEILLLHRFAPKLLDSPKVLFDDDYLKHKLQRGVGYSCLAHAFVECLKKRSPTKLKTLDLSGYPTVEVVLNYLSSHVMLVHNETRQREIISMYNNVLEDLPTSKKHEKTNFEVDATLPDEIYVVSVDAFIQSEDSHMALCKALRTSSKAECKFKLRLSTIAVLCLGLPRICVLLEEVDPQYLIALSLQFNDLRNDSLGFLQPLMKRLDQLTTLDLAYNSIILCHQEPAVQLADILADLPQLQRLDLSSNRIKNRLPMLLSRMQQPLSYLKLCGCGIADLDLLFLKSSHHATSLRELDISNNDLGSRHGNLLGLLSVLRNNLLVLEMEECKLEASSVPEIIGVLSSSKCLRYLNLYKNEPWSEALTSHALRDLAGVRSLQAVQISFPAECYDIHNPDNGEESIADYTNITNRVMTELFSLCQEHARPELKVVFKS